MDNGMREDDPATPSASGSHLSRNSRRRGSRLLAIAALGVLLMVLVGCNPIAVPGDGQATVSWPVGDGNGNPIIGYQVTPYVGGIAQDVRTFHSTATTQTVTGLTNGTTYTFRITPITSCSGPCGLGTPSPPTRPITVGAPTAPGDPSATAGNQSAEVTWSAPSTDNGSSITGYVVTPVLGASALPSQTFSSTATSETVTGLTAGTTYTFRVAAINGRGTGPYSTSLPLVLGPPASAITTGYYHSCMLLTTGTVNCWGWNVGGQLGDGTTTDRSTPVAVQGLTGVTAITAGDYHSCALLTTGTVECWGANWSGQLGDGSGVSNSTTPVPVKHLSGVVAVTAGSTYTCALLADSTARCWGENSAGELGDGTTTNRPTPVVVKGLTGAAALAGGQQHTCALLSTATEMCWGYNNWGQVGDGTTTNRSTPVAVQGLTGVAAITNGDHYSCALLTAGSARCWGWNVGGELGDGTTTDRSTPVAVQGLSGVIALTAGGYQSCALSPAGTETCWGNNWFGEVGDGTTTSRSTPVPVPGLVGVTAIFNGGYHSCARITNGSERCWGENQHGQLGDGTTTDRHTPVTVQGT